MFALHLNWCLLDSLIFSSCLLEIVEMKVWNYSTFLVINLLLIIQSKCLWFFIWFNRFGRWSIDVNKIVILTDLINRNIIGLLNLLIDFLSNYIYILIILYLRINLLVRLRLKCMYFLPSDMLLINAIMILAVNECISSLIYCPFNQCTWARSLLSTLRIGLIIIIVHMLKIIIPQLNGWTGLSWTQINSWVYRWLLNSSWTIVLLLSY